MEPVIYIYCKQCHAVRWIQSFVLFALTFDRLQSVRKDIRPATIQLRFEPDKSILTCTKWDIKPWFCVRDGYVWIFRIWFQSCIPDAESFKKVGLLCCWCFFENAIVDGSEIRQAPVEVGILSHYLQAFVHPTWCRISSINSSFWYTKKVVVLFWSINSIT